jgi:glycosyltransferase involved in cell wall biosynthesis
VRLLVTANLTPFLHGGADYHMQGLVRALREHGHQVELLQLPFTFGPASDLMQFMRRAAELDLTRPNGIEIDRLISLQFPTWGIRHPDHVTWVMHQHRAVYDLFNPENADDTLLQLKTAITEFDNTHLGTKRPRFANSRRVAQRMQQFNGLDSKVLYHPPADADRFYCAEPERYLYVPSRLETLKRQSLVLEAAALMRSSLPIVFSGDGGQREALRVQAETLGLNDRVRFLGHVSETEKRALYAHSLAVVFPAQDEDYGYITLEAMLSSKAVVVCSDGGGPLEFINHQSNGWVEPPTAQALAERFDWLDANAAAAAAAGRTARSDYESASLNWQSVVEQLTASAA